MTINKFKPDANPEEISKIIPSHIQWVKKLISEGIIVQAGKWGDSGGMAILKENSILDAEKILSKDPLVRSGLITFKLARFYPDVEIK